MMKLSRRIQLASAIAALSAVGCKPDLGSPASLVTGLRILGVKTEPPETMGGATVSANLLAVDPSGRLAPDAAWSLCKAHKPPAENNIISHECAVGGPALVSAGVKGPTAMVTIPMDTCALNGPEAPPTKPGDPVLRARDPDITGGYYQPIGVEISAPAHEQAFVLERISCNLPDLALDVVQDFQKRYQANTNPALTGLLVGGAALVPVTPGMPAAASPVQAGQTITFQAEWMPKSREKFPVYDRAVHAIVDHYEDLTVSWFATAGEFDRDRTGRTEAETDSTITNTWVAPTEAGPVHLWIVLRDNRGGLDFREYLLSVK